MKREEVVLLSKKSGDPGGLPVEICRHVHGGGAPEKKKASPLNVKASRHKIMTAVFNRERKRRGGAKLHF